MKTAYQTVEKIVADEPVFQVPSAVDNRGRIVAWAVDLAFVRLIDSGRLPFDYQWKTFNHPTGRYLEIRPSHSVVTISQVADPKKQPRSVRFRENGRMNNEPFFPLPEFADEQEIKGFPHLLLVHGHQQLNFAHLTVPHPMHHRDYRFRTDNLLHMAHEVPTSGPPVEDTDTDFESTELLKQDIEKWRKDHGD
ncbi:hypothetical protein J2R99_000076 [Rhodopseudomonas julia]|uniref:Uncharacterized protein n=1 Tax=Rhodopseudomonas julia TaxID=200617 RepID=A0ABU0C1Y4_9BRAD|nr:hypothetical protein [Rhodopseudomonas julia]MDQ0324227.1 hypothetical protein [Rhodopseudomonas julia]